MNAHDHAVVIGISRSADAGKEPAWIGNLNGPDNDAAAVAAWLRKPDGGGLPEANLSVISSAEALSEEGDGEESLASIGAPRLARYRMAEQEKVPNLARCHDRNACHRRALPPWRASTLRHRSSTSSPLSTTSTVPSSASSSSSEPG